MWQLLDLLDFIEMHVEVFDGEVKLRGSQTP